MEGKISIIKLLGLPETFAVVLLTFSFILVLAPYFSGADFGLFKIPQFTDSARKKLKMVGPVIFLVLVILFVPIIRAPVPANSRSSESSNNDDKHPTVSNAQTKSISEPSIDDQVQGYLRRARELNDRAEFKEALTECEKAIAKEPQNQEALVLKKQITDAIEIEEKYRNH